MSLSSVVMQRQRDPGKDHWALMGRMCGGKEQKDCILLQCLFAAWRQLLEAMEHTHPINSSL